MNNVEKNKSLKVITKHIFQHNVYVKQMTYPDANSTYHGHHHDYDHITLIAAGKVKVKFKAIPEMNIPEETKEYSAVDTFVTRAFREHEITSLEPNTVVCCVHAIRDSEGDILAIPPRVGHEQDPDEKFESWHKACEAMSEIKKTRMAFSATPQDLNEMYKRAEKEGTLVSGSQDMLL